MLATLLSVGAMTGAALMIVSTSVPANAFLTAESSVPSVMVAPVAEEVQSVEWESPDAAAAEVARDGYTATSLREQIAQRYGNHRFLYLPGTNGTIRWPFPIAVPISSGYGPRVAPCADCSTFHRGVDFLPGRGAPIGVIADGVVVSVNDLHWSFGQHVLVEHVIDGVPTQSLYAHMAVDSMFLKAGQTLSVGEVIGLVGNTGQSVGPHLHLEIRVGGEPIDAFAWLQKHAH